MERVLFYLLSLYNGKSLVYVKNEAVTSAYAGWGIGTGEEEVSCLTTGELVSGGVIHVLPVTDVVPLDVSGRRPDGKQQPNPADALFSSIVLNFFGAYSLNLRIKLKMTSFLAREKTKQEIEISCWLAERILRPSSRETPARVDHGTHLRGDLCYGNNVSRSRIDSVQDRELRQGRGSKSYQYEIGLGSQSSSPLGRAISYPRHEGNRKRITCYIANLRQWRQRVEILLLKSKLMVVSGNKKSPKKRRKCILSGLF